MKILFKNIGEVIITTWKQIVFAIAIAIGGVWLINRYSFFLSGERGTILFYSIYLLLLIYTLGFNKILFKQFIKPSRYMFSLYIAVSFSFVIISIIFGFHTDLLVKYDNVIGGNPYHWINPINVLQFPLDQSLRNDEQPIDRISLNTDTTTSSINVFVIDNTASVQNDTFTNEYAASKINKSNLKKINVSHVQNSNQIIAPLLLSVVFQNDLTENNDAILYKYDGRTSSVMHSLIDINSTTKIEKKYFKSNTTMINNSLIDSLESVKGGDGVTDLNDFFNIKEIVKHVEINRYKSIKIYFISDYQDEKGIKNFYPNLDTLLRLEKIKSVCFVRTRGMPNRQDAYEKVVGQGAAFREGDGVTINELNFLKRDPDVLNWQLELMCSSIHQNSNVDSSIVFSYPYKTRSGKLNLTSQLYINAQDENLTFCLRNLDNSNDFSSFSLEVNGKAHSPAPKINEHFIVHDRIRSDDIIKFTFSNYYVYENTRLRLDIYSKRLNSVTSRWCEILPVVPINSINLLVMFYSVLIFSLSMMFIYAQFSVIYLIKTVAIKSNGTLNSSSIVPVILLSLYIIPLFYVLYCYGKEYPLCVIMILLSIILITVTHYLLFLNSQLKRWIAAEYKLIMVFE